MTELADRELKPPRSGAPLQGEALHALHQELGHSWQLTEGSQLEKEFRFKDFRQALDFVNRVGELAERVDHHPDIHLAWGRAKVSISSHSIGGLSEGDFIFAARCDRLADF